MDDHGPDCPACTAAPLTDEDRAFLREHGWAEPQHIQPTGLETDNTPLIPSLLVVKICIVAIAAFACLIWAPTATAVLLPGLALLFVVRLRAHRHSSHVPECFRCRWRRRREIDKRWDEYRRLRVAEQTRLLMQSQALARERQREQQRAWDAANYQRLLEQQRREQQS